jgi:large subunit ribosomal protein L13
MLYFRILQSTGFPSFLGIITFKAIYMKTYLPKVNEIEHKCFVIDAKDQILGKVAAKAASVLRGKHKRIFTPFLDTGDTVIIINAEKVRVTGKKLTDKVYSRYTGYPSGQREMTLGVMLQKAPEKVLELAVSRMFPSGPLAYKQTAKLKVYAGDVHPHAAQKPIALEI